MSHKTTSNQQVIDFDLAQQLEQATGGQQPTDGYLLIYKKEQAHDCRAITKTVKEFEL